MKIQVSGQAFSTIQGSEMYYSPENYDGGSAGAIAAHAALNTARARRVGKGYSYTVDVDEAGARTIREYCLTVGSTFADETEAETRAEGRALLRVVARIDMALRPTTPGERRRL